MINHADNVGTRVLNVLFEVNGAYAAPVVCTPSGGVWNKGDGSGVNAGGFQTCTTTAPYWPTKMKLVSDTDNAPFGFWKVVLDTGFTT